MIHPSFATTVILSIVLLLLGFVLVAKIAWDLLVMAGIGIVRSIRRFMVIITLT
jgi:hypothetical protein